MSRRTGGRRAEDQSAAAAGAGHRGRDAEHDVCTAASERTQMPRAGVWLERSSVFGAVQLRVIVDAMNFEKAITLRRCELTDLDLVNVCLWQARDAGETPCLAASRSEWRAMVREMRRREALGARPSAELS